MDLEEVKKHFKNAKEVRCLFDGYVFSFKDITDRGIYKAHSSYWFDSSEDIDSDCKLWDEHKGFAEIISYKKDAKRIKEDCELLYKFYLELPASHSLGATHTLARFKKDNGLIIKPTELDKLKQSHAELMEKAEEVKQQIDKLK